MSNESSEITLPLSPLNDPELTEAMRTMANVVQDERERRLIAATILGPLLQSLENRYTTFAAAGHRIDQAQMRSEIDQVMRTALVLADQMITFSKEPKIKV